MSKLLSFGSYAIGTLVMAFGWLCALAQADAPKGDPRSAPVIAVFAIAATSLVFSAIFMQRANRLAKWIMFPLIGLQSACCLYAILAEFAL